ncbi:STM4014 family protein [Stigmatella erecta]|uniref:Glutathione synthase/RimK-type ligase, ATP-grasp superfamily n=1 Tax=Stigmatella erecta TaxID=83460 RepID=A0A1I0D0T8_9BACT|nr:STM4014 family protein [Stigmatella erecta]SET25506.1 Glutathione synthase/RimK-type ligase, ATP-grasp superfamily [Stigmatella erecta]
MAVAPPFILIGNAENRRVTLFQEALAGQGLPPAHVVSWSELLSREGRLEELPDTEAMVRIDSAGENWEVEKALLKRGYTDALEHGCSVLTPEEVDALPLDLGRILCPRQHHLGFLRILAQLEALFARRPRWRVLQPPAAIADLFDKRITSRRYAALGVPVPEPLEDITDVASLRARMHEAGCREVFVKVSCGSSASCLAIFRRGRSTESLVTTIEQAETGWYNSLKVRRIQEPRRVDEVLTFLLREGSQVERSIPKARLGGDYFDCRVLMVRGEPAFTVVRQSHRPITNLHLGGWRGDLEDFRAAVPPNRLADAMESCRAVARAHDCLHVGIDLMYEEHFTGHRVLEANAFGDLLPRLWRDGLSVYAWEIREALREH